MNKTEATRMPLKDKDHRNYLLKTLNRGYHNIREEEKREPESLDFDLGRGEIISTLTDETFLKAAKAGMYRACWELYEAGEGDLAKQELQKARKSRF